MKAKISVKKYLINQYISYQDICQVTQKVIIYESHYYKSSRIQGISPEWQAMIDVVKKLDSGLHECVYSLQNMEKIRHIRQKNLLHEIRQFKALNITGSSVEWDGITAFTAKKPSQ